MKMRIINVSRNELLAKLRMVGRITQAGKGHPVMGQFWLKTNGDNTLTVTGTDLSGTISAVVECIDTDGDVSVLVDAKMLTGVLGNLSEQPLTLKVDDKKVTLEYFGGYFDIPHFDAGEFPTVAIEDDATLLTIKADNLAGAIVNVADCAGSDELRPLMNSVYVELKGATLSVVSTNAQVLALQDMAYLGGDEVSAVIPVKAARLMVNLLSGLASEEVLLKISPKKVSVEAGEYRLIYSLLEGRYPNYRGVIPQNDKTVEVGVKELADAIRRVSVLAEKQYTLMRLKVDKDVMTLVSEDADFGTYSKEELTVNANFNEPFEIGLRASYLLMLLEKLPGQKCRLLFSTPERAMTITPVEAEGIVMLVMPMMLS